MYLKQMMDFFVRAQGDHRMGPLHVALYMAVFQEWCIVEGKSPVQVTQARLREVAKVGRTTYHKCMRELQTYGYIKYIPSMSAVVGHLVYLEPLAITTYK